MANTHDSGAAGLAGDEISPYRIHVSSKYLDLTKQKLELTRLPHEPSEPNKSRDWWEPKSRIEPLIDFWLEKYDWREQETAFNNQLPQFRTAITPPSSSSPVRLHFIHIRSSHSNAIPLLLIPPFPFTNLSLGHLIQPLAEPESSSSEDGEQQLQQPFHVVIPSLPGLGFSDALPSDDASVIPTTTDLLNTLMTRLSYPYYLVSNTASAASSPAQIDWKLADHLVRHYPSNCLGAHFISPSLAAPTLKEAPLEWMKWSLAKFFHAPILGYQSEDLRSLDEETHASHTLSAGRRRPLPTSLQPGAGSTLVEPNTTSFALCDSPVGLLALVLKVIRVLGAKKEFSAAEIITFTQTAWLPGPEAAMRLWARCLTHQEPTPPPPKPSKKPNVAITVFSGTGETGDVSGGRRTADDDLEAQTQSRNDVDILSPQPAPNPYVCPAWANVSYNAVHVRRVPVPGGRPGLVAWDHPELIGDGVRGLAANLLSFDARVQDIVAQQQQRPETVPLQGVVVQSDSSGSTAATASSQQGGATSAAPVLPSTPQVEATKWRLSQIREASETPKKSLQLDDGDAGMMLSPPDADFAGASPDTIVVTPPVDMK
ncbi:epoxide hydrolase [Colletotrichum costaricense]|uniref:Epoxide hydrolase n=1 Tax=Colletotrichum costaricense TaxID=1209916 RepID=A0AAI9ZAM7_9PEZI|nr:epoxide hydrolase [Colletotrichum costaricense]KAK1539639.1 epoxide hydrolase [Colletotrichum costaricense]